MDIYDFILKHEQEDIARLLFKNIPNIKWIVQQIEGRRIAQSKIPSFYQYKNIHYPVRLSLEQCSSEYTAQYKSTLMKGETYIDLTGGFGIDSLFCAKHFQKAIYIEKNAELVEIFRHNVKVLDIPNINVYLGDSIEFLTKNTEKYSWLYLDPARRDNKGKKIFLLSDCEPNILIHWDIINQKADNILLKTSPMLDIKTVLQQLPVTDVHIVAVKNEVKEVLYVMEKDKTTSDKITCVDIYEDKMNAFTGHLSTEQSINIEYHLPQKYLYEPNKAILKSGLFKQLALQYSVFKLAPNSHLYTSESYIQNFMGRAFEIIQILPYQKKTFQTQNTLKYFNIIARNFPDTAEQIAKKLSLTMGGETDYLIATKNLHYQNILIVAKRLY